MMCRPRNFKVWVRVLICFLTASMIQPSLVLCFDHNGGAVVEYGPCNAPSCSASEASHFPDPLNQTCHSCADVPSSMADIGGKSSSTNPIEMASGIPHSTMVASLSRFLLTHSYATFPEFAHRDNSRPHFTHRDNSRHGTIRTTVLLI
jgi:hypothetical protein